MGDTCPADLGDTSGGPENHGNLVVVVQRKGVSGRERKGEFTGRVFEGVQGETDNLRGSPRRLGNRAADFAHACSRAGLPSLHTGPACHGRTNESELWPFVVDEAKANVREEDMVQPVTGLDADPFAFQSVPQVTRSASIPIPQSPLLLRDLRSTPLRRKPLWLQCSKTTRDPSPRMRSTAAGFRRMQTERSRRRRRRRVKRKAFPACRRRAPTTQRGGTHMVLAVATEEEDVACFLYSPKARTDVLTAPA